MTGDVGSPRPEVTCEIGDDHVALVEVHRGPHNYLSPSTLATLVNVLENVATEGNARAVVLCAEGKNFCAGADFRGDMAEDGAKARLYRKVPELLRTKVPIVAAVQGAAVGGGVGLALVADFRVATPDTRFACNFSMLGFHQGFGLSVTLPAVIGTQRAAELLYTGRNVRGAEAMTIGLCDRLVDFEALRDEARRFACEIAQAAPLAVRSIRTTIRGDLAERVDAALQHELDEQDRLMLTADFREGLQASAERGALPRFWEGDVDQVDNGILVGLLTGHVAIVTGAAGGQGEAEARLFHSEGAQVVLADVSDERGQFVADDLGSGAIFVHLNVAEREDWNRALQVAESTFGPVDVLINNAAILRHETVLTVTEESFLEVMRVNTWSCLLGMQTVAPGMQELGHGSIVNVASTGAIIGQVGVIAYVSSKFAVRGVTKAAALELAPDIRVNSLHPGWVDTAMGRNGQDTAEYVAKLAPIVPIGRAAEPAEVASSALFLASDMSSYLTGSELVVDGGRTAGTPRST